MNEERIINSLARAARGDGPPTIDVVDRVVDRIAVAPHPGDRVLWIFTAASGLAAAAAFVAATLVSQVATDPMVDFINSVGSFL